MPEIPTTDSKTLPSQRDAASVPGKQRMRPLARWRRLEPCESEHFLFYAPPGPDCVLLKKTRNSSLRFACIVEDRLAQGLRFEGEMLLLTPYNWKHVLRYASPAFLLVESFWRSSTGHWHMGLNPASPFWGELTEIMACARSLNIPTVFWMTRSHAWHEHYKDFARCCDIVCCADSKEVDNMKAEGIKADFLPPCTQPALFHPFKMYKTPAAPKIPILFDGLADLMQYTQLDDILAAMLPMGLGMIESRYALPNNKVKTELPGYGRAVKGCVTFHGRLKALKQADACATLGTSLSSNITQQWMVLEAAACGLPVAHYGDLPADDLRGECALPFSEAEDFVGEFFRYSKDPLYRQRVGHLGWRQTNMRHTFAHRMRDICRLAGIFHDWEEHPRVSVITPCCRREFLPRAIETYRNFLYPNKEFVLVFNGDAPPPRRDLGLDEERMDIVYTHVPGEMFAGAALNVGAMLASGEYCFRVDDDDCYGQHYLRDMILQARCVDAVIFGKPELPFRFSEEQETYQRENVLSQMIVPLSDMRNLTKGFFLENTMAGKTEIFRKYCHDDEVYDDADLFFKYGLPDFYREYSVLMDKFNLVARRRDEMPGHTWRMQKDDYFL
jgi:hypothetical protein